jgi:hypothetical protein
MPIQKLTIARRARRTMRVSAASNDRPIRGVG